MTASAAFLLLLFLIIGHATPKDLDERAEEALEYCKETGTALSIVCWWTMAGIPEG